MYIRLGRLILKDGKAVLSRALIVIRLGIAVDIWVVLHCDALTISYRPGVLISHLLTLALIGVFINSLTLIKTTACRCKKFKSYFDSRMESLNLEIALSI